MPSNLRLRRAAIRALACPSPLQTGAIQLALGAFDPGLQAYDRALALDPDHPAALLGSAELLAASASTHIALGATGLAAAELAAAAARAARCARQHGTLQTAWKQLGDALVLHHSVNPSPELFRGNSGRHPTDPILEQLAVTGDPGLAAWAGRVRAVVSARRAYARALHLCPSAGGAWQDVASTFYHEQQLRRAHAAFAAAGGPPADRLTRGTERLLRGGLRLDPASPELWTALGCAAGEGATREYALGRALQLDPKSVPAWVALARLYIDAGERGLAGRCLQQARSNDPAQPVVWEAMAALAALGGPSGARDRADLAEHSLGLLGAGPEGMLAFAEAALRTVGSRAGAGRERLGAGAAGDGAAALAAASQPAVPDASDLLPLPGCRAVAWRAPSTPAPVACPSCSRSTPPPTTCLAWPARPAATTPPRCAATAPPRSC